MVNQPSRAPNTAAEQALSDALASILAGLRDMAASRAGRYRFVAPFVLLLWPYLHRAASRFARLVARWQAGILTPPSPPRPARAATGARKPALPGAFAWVVQLVPDAAPFRTQLEALLQRPDMAALLAAAPQAARILRPLCRMLGCRPVDLPPALRKPVPRRPPAVAHAPPIDQITPALVAVPPGLRFATK